VTEPVTMQFFGQAAAGVFFVLPITFADFASASPALSATTVAKPRIATNAAIAIAVLLVVVRLAAIKVP
jgi:hypothetical protein